MKRHTKIYCVLVLAQAACLAFGLWLEHRFALAVAPQTEQAGQFLEPVEEQATESEGQDEPSAAPRHGARRGTAGVEISVLAFIWITALQAAVAYLLLARTQEQALRETKRIASVSLQRYNDLLRTRDAVIFGLAKLAESRDSGTGNHLERVAVYSTRLATALRGNPRYGRQLTSAFVKLIGISSALHDIGKVGIGDQILLKPGKLGEQERLVMQMHAAIGGKCVREIESRLGRSNFLQMAREIAFSHHEHWDGSGYPDGLLGEEIPLAARIVAVADVYDALATSRVYKAAFAHRKCVELIKAEAGKQFDPAVVAAFLEVEAEFRAIAIRCRDVSEAPPEGDNSSRRDWELAAMTATPANDQRSVATTVLDTYDDRESYYAAQKV